MIFKLIIMKIVFLFEASVVSLLLNWRLTVMFKIKINSSAVPKSGTFF
jgi:hypothetical protein